jgi:hypothetical protein
MTSRQRLRVSLDVATAVGHIANLRAVERRLAGGDRTRVASVRTALEAAVGRTVRPAVAARVLGLSQASLGRWLDLGEIAPVLTPQGRREVPVTELVGLLAELDEIPPGPGKRRVKVVIDRRRARAASSIDVAWMASAERAGHDAAALRSLAYHRVVSSRLDEDTLTEARARVERWSASGSVHPDWVSRWERLLALPLPEVAEALSSDSVEMGALRQTSPFAGLLNEQERGRLLAAVAGSRS